MPRASEGASGAPGKLCKVLPWSTRRRGPRAGADRSRLFFYLRGGKGARAEGSGEPITKRSRQPIFPPFSFLIPDSAWFWGENLNCPLKPREQRPGVGEGGGRREERGLTLSECLLLTNGWPRGVPAPGAPTAPRSLRLAGGLQGNVCLRRWLPRTLAFPLASQVSARCLSHLLLHFTRTRNFPRVGPRATPRERFTTFSEIVSALRG